MGKKHSRKAVAIAGRRSDAEPQDEDGHDRRLGHGIDADEERVEAAVDQAEGADEDAEQQADRDPEREAEDGVLQREQRVVQDGIAVFEECREHRRRRRQDERRRCLGSGRRPATRREADDDQPGHRGIEATPVAAGHVERLFEAQTNLRSAAGGRNRGS